MDIKIFLWRSTCCVLYDKWFFPHVFCHRNPTKSIVSCESSAKSAFICLAKPYRILFTDLKATIRLTGYVKCQNI